MDICYAVHAAWASAEEKQLSEVALSAASQLGLGFVFICFMALILLITVSLAAQAAGQNALKTENET